MTLQHGYFIEELRIGMEASYEKQVSDGDVLAFADLTGDENPVHLDDVFAASTMFKARIAHGMLSASLISTVLGTRLPGPGCIYLSQSLRFRAPVRIGDTVKAVTMVSEINLSRNRVKLDCTCSVDEQVVLDGEAMVMVASRGQES